MRGGRNATVKRGQSLTRPRPGPASKKSVHLSLGSVRATRAALKHTLEAHGDSRALTDGGRVAVQGEKCFQRDLVMCVFYLSAALRPSAVGTVGAH
jgi:hypothetical protein